MTRLLRPIPALIALLALVAVLAAAGCGGGGSSSSGGGKVSADAIAKVGNESIPKSRFDALIGQTQRSYKQQKRAFPASGTTEYRSLQDQAVNFLVQRAEFAQKAKDLGITITDKQVADRLKQIKQQYFGGSEKRYKDQLKAQQLTDEQVKDDLRAQLISEELFKKVTANVKVSDGDIRQYYLLHSQDYAKPQTRSVRHILVKTKALADKIRAQLVAGGSWKTLAKKYSTDPGSKDKGGEYDNVQKGQFVPEFDAALFSLKTKQISQPIKTQYGYHIIQPLNDATPRKAQPLKSVKDQIQQTLLQQKRSEAMTKWVDDLKKEFGPHVSYQVGFAPTATATSTTTTTG
jgi:parvulin-like peptidyl-prolyl isomerase